MDFGTRRWKPMLLLNKKAVCQKRCAHLEVDYSAKLAKVLIEFADVVELWGNLPNGQFSIW